MNMQFEIEEQDQTFDLQFANIEEATDGGYERGYAAGYERGRIDFDTPTQEKTIEIVKNGTVEIAPDDGYTLSKATVAVNVAGTGGGGDPDLPTGYRRVSYIQFNDAQIVDTGIACNQDSKIKVQYTREVSTSAYLYGCASTDNTASVTAYLGGNWRFGNKYNAVNPTTSADLINTAIQDKSGIDRIAAINAYSGVADFETIGSVLIGGSRNANGTVGVASYVGKIFLFAMWQGDEQVLKLIPVTNGTVFRFWDSVSQTFFDSITDMPLNGGNL